VILIDYNAIAISNVIATKLQVDENIIRHQILNSIRIHRAKHTAKCGEVVICCDASNYWRKDDFPQYKHSRGKTRDTDKIDWDELFRIIELVLSELRDNFPYKVIRIDRCEADDIIAELCEHTQEFGQYERMMIISGDKDFAQLQKHDNIAQYAPVQRKFIKEDNAKGFLAEHILKGDAADGIPNVLSQDDCFVEGIRQTPLRRKVVDQLLADPNALGEDVYRNIQRNTKLIDLTQIPVSLKEQIINSFNSQQPAANKGKVLNYLIDKQCRLLIESAGDFING
jgi:hypothetical protein